MNLICTNSVTIASGTSLSGWAQLNGQVLRGIIMPAGWDAAALTLQASEDGATWADLYDENGVAITIQASGGARIKVPYGWVDTISYLRLRSGTAAAPVAQTADRTFALVSRSHL